MITAPTNPAVSRDALLDRFGRVARSLRISVTDRCNLRCLYCMPATGVGWFPKNRILTFEEIRRVVSVLASLGVREVRLTGGEPLLRRDLPALAAMLAAIEGIEDLAVTTNGLLLATLAEPLLAASRRDALAPALEGLAVLERLGAVPIKINVVLMRGVNDQEIPRFAEIARQRPYQVRFIELMPLGGGEPLELDRLVPGAEVRRRIEAIHPLLPVGRDRPAAPATLFRFADGLGDIGFINPVTEPFCGDCDRIRLTADGMLRNCLFARRETDLRAILRGGGSDEEIAAAALADVAAKERGGCLELQRYYDDRLPRKMWQIGG